MEKINENLKRINESFVEDVKTEIVLNFNELYIPYFFSEQGEEELSVSTWFKVLHKTNENIGFYFGFKIYASFNNYIIEVISEVSRDKEKCISEISSIYKGTYKELDKELNFPYFE